MKKTAYLLVLCLLLSLTTACQPRSASDDKHPATTAASDSINLANSAAPEESTQPEATPSVIEVCQGLKEYIKSFSSPNGPIENQYAEYDNLGAFGWAYIDGQHYYWYDTYPSNDWTVEEVAQYYREHPYAWGDDPTAARGQATKHYLWTPDYSQRFVADTADNWLYIDGIRVTPLDQTTMSMNPKDLIEAFQTHEWDGITPARSDDFSTYVTVEPEYGLLAYEFDVEKYPTEPGSEWGQYPIDTKGIAYTSYNDATPWWEDEQNNYDVPVMHSSTYTSSSEGLNTAFYTSSTTGVLASAWAIAYVDVPWDKQDTLLAVQCANKVYHDGNHSGEYAYHALYAQRTSDGLHALVNNGVQLWRGGYLRQTWKAHVDENSYLIIDHYGRNYLCTDGQLLELLDDGTTSVVIDDVVSTNLQYDDCVACFTLSDDHVLRFCYLDDANTIQATEVAQGVVAADLSDDDLVLYTDDTGRTYAIYDFLGSDAGIIEMAWHREIACLGEGTIAEFKECYDLYATERKTRFCQDDFIKETSAAYGNTDAAVLASALNLPADDAIAYYRPTT